MIQLAKKRYSPSIKNRSDARLLWAIGDISRLNILEILRDCEGTITVFELADRLWIRQPTVSHHLRILLETGLIDFEKKGLEMFYYIIESRLQEAQDIIEALKPRKDTISE